MSRDAPRDHPSAIRPQNVISSSAADPGQRIYLEQLPNEILSQIVWNLPSASSLARVSKHVHAVTAKAMAQKLTVPISQLEGVLKWLADHQELMDAVLSLQVIGSQPWKASAAPPSVTCDFDARREKILSDKILSNSNIPDLWDRLQSQSALYNITSPSRYYLNMIIMLCPNLRAITMEPQAMQPCHDAFSATWQWLSVPGLPIPALPMANPWAQPAPPFENASLPILQEKLRSLTIPERRLWAGHVRLEILRHVPDIDLATDGRQPTTLGDFRSLRHLDVTLDIFGELSALILWSPYSKEAPRTVTTMHDGAKSQQTKTLELPTKLLPLTLRHLQLRACNSSVFKILHAISQAAHGTCDIKNVEVYFSTSARDFVHHDNKSKVQWPVILDELSARGIAVTYFSGKDAKPVDVRREIDFMLSMDPNEVAALPSSHATLTTMDPVAIQHRKTSSSAHTLFIQHALSHLALLNRPTFIGEQWCNVAFFSGALPFSPTPPIGQAVLSVSSSPNERKFNTRRHRPIRTFDLNGFVFSVKSMPRMTIPSALSAPRQQGDAVKRRPLRTKRTVQPKPQQADVVSTSSPAEELLGISTVFAAKLWQGEQWQRHFHPRMLQTERRDFLE
ncbi:hypothetical protein ACEQ8H_006789 [Pleosporales sp. CAS-2024a]